MYFEYGCKYPPSFISLLEADDSPQIERNNTGPITPINPHMSYLPYLPQPSYHYQPYQPHYPPQPNQRNSIGNSSQNLHNYPPLYYPHHIMTPKIYVTLSTHVTVHTDHTILHHLPTKITFQGVETPHPHPHHPDQWSG